MARDFNNIRKWLEPKLRERGWSVERFSIECGLSRSIIYFYMNDRHRPDVESMEKMCEALKVPLEEGLGQYSTRRRGRPDAREERRGRPKASSYNSHLY